MIFAPWSNAVSISGVPAGSPFMRTVMGRFVAAATAFSSFTDCWLISVAWCRWRSYFLGFPNPR